MSTTFLSPERERFIEDFAALLTPWGMPLHAARLYAYIMLKNEPVGLDEIGADLRLSKSKACVAGQLLEETGNARRTKLRGSKRVYYEAPDDYSGPIIGQSRLLETVARLLRERGPTVASGAAAKRLKAITHYYRTMSAAMDDVIEKFSSQAPSSDSETSSVPAKAPVPMPQLKHPIYAHPLLLEDGTPRPKVIVVTGAGGGLGRTLALQLAADGDTVVLLGRTLARLESVAAAAGENALAVECDVSSPASVERAFAAIAAQHPHIDVLINNAAQFEPLLIAEASDERILGTIGTNLTGPILCTRAAIPMLSRGGQIINVSSESVNLPYPHLLLYQSSKAGLERFAEGLRSELEPRGIRVSVVRAGQMWDEEKGASDFDPAVAARFNEAAMAAGLNLAERPISHFSSVAPIFRSLIDLPPDLHIGTVHLHARNVD